MNRGSIYSIYTASTDSLCVLTVTFEGFPLHEAVYLTGECHSLCLRWDAFPRASFTPFALQISMG